MVRRCIVEACKSEYYPDCKLSFHKLPTDPMREKWLNIIPSDSRKITHRSVICSKHFKPEDYVPNLARPVLKENSVPSLFLFPVSKKIQVISAIELSAGSIKHQDVHIPTEPPSKKPRTEELKDVCVQTQKTEESEELKRKVKVLTQKLRRRDCRIQDMKTLLSVIKTKCNNYNEVQMMIKTNFIDIHNYINKDKCSKGVRYSDEIKKFALSLYYFSSRAYCYLRTHIALPHPATLRKMLATNKCNPGFMQEVFDFLKLSVQNDEALKNFALIFDSMSIRSEIVYDKNTDKYWGYVDYGGIVTVANAEDVATEVLVFQIISLKKKLKCPIGYFILNKISANVQAQLILTAIRLLSNIDIIVRSLTCDGTATNIATYENLGCNFNFPEMITYFKHPCRDLKVYCILDPPHMLKLARNIFAETNLGSEKGQIKFEFVQKLHEIQQEEGLRLANKLCDAHINFFNKKMNVRLAGQLLSSSVADAIDFMRETGHPSFANSQSTVEYIRMLDRIFDLMNCKNPFGTGYKSPLRNENKEVWTNVLNETKKYLASLNIDGKNILQHRRKTPVLGLLVNITSFENLALDLLKLHDFKYFLTYKCSQDHLEMLFSCIRARGGSNDNPNALQFRFTLRKLLYRNGVQPSINANCTSNDYEITPVLEFRSKKKAILEVSDNNDDQSVIKLLDLIGRSNVSDFKMNIIYYIAGCVTNKLVSKITCTYCYSVLLTKKNTDHQYSVYIFKFSAFTTYVDRGGLKYASRFVFEVLKYCEKVFTTMSNDSLRNLNKNKMILTVVQEFHYKLFKYLEISHPLQCIQTEEPHEIQLVKSLSNSYFNLRSYHLTKLKSTKITKGSIGLRQKLHKTILFSNM